MKSKKLLVLSSLLALGLFAGCANGENPSTSLPISSETTSVETSSNSETSSTSQAPVLTITGVVISGASETMEAGEELVLTATVKATGGEDTLGVIWSSSNENVATVDATGKVTALSVTSDTDVTITATSKKDSSKSQSVTIKVLKSEDLTLFGEKANIANGEEGVALSSVNTMIEWHDQGNWVGGTSTITKAETEANTITFEYSQTEGSAWFGTQLFYKNSSLTASTAYKLSLKITSDVAAKITVNGKAIDIVAGENNVEVKYLEASNKASLSIQFGTEADGAVLAMNTTIEVLGWTDITNDKVALSAPTNVTVTANETEGMYTLGFDAVDHAAGYMYSLQNSQGTALSGYEYVACENGTVIDLRSLDTATYKVVVQAVGDKLEYLDSAPSEAVSINHTKPAERVAQTYHADFGTEVIDLSFGAAVDAGTTPIYWNDQNWCGSNTAVKFAMAKEDQIQFRFEGATIDFGFQLFLTNNNVIVGSKYKLKMNIWSDVAGKVTINGQDVDLKVGDNIVSVEFTSANADQNGNKIASAITFKNNEISAATLKMSNIRWTEVIDGVADTDVGQACEEPDLLKELKTEIAAPVGVVYNAEAKTVAFAAVTNAVSYKVTVYSDSACATETSFKDVAITNGGVLDTSALEAGTYYLKVFAVAEDGTVSEGSTAVTLTVAAPVDDSDEEENPGEGEENPGEQLTDYSVTLSSGVGGAWLNAKIDFNGKAALTMDDVNIKSAKITLASGNELKSTGKVGVEAISATSIKVGIGFASAEFVAAQNHTFEIIIKSGDKYYKLTEVFTGEASTEDKVFTVISRNIEETVIEEEAAPEVGGEATIICTDANKTRFEGAGAFVWIDASSIEGYSVSKFATMEASAVAEIYDAGGVKTGLQANNVVLQQATETVFCAYVICSGAPVDGWATTINLTIVLDGKAYTCTAHFNGTAYVAE